MSFITDTIGLPYCLHNRRGVNCWGLVALYYKNLGVELPDYRAEALNIRAISAAFTLAILEGEHGFKITTSPTDGDVVIFKSKTQTHCGIWLKGKVLHSSPSVNGVAYQKLEDFSSFLNIEFWTYDKDTPPNNIG